MDYKEKIIALLNSQELSKEQKEKLENIFPELAESEEERIRKVLINYFNHHKNAINIFYGIKGDDILAWLEKQKKLEDVGEISDGYHTFNELYRYRMLYNAAFFNLLPKEIVHKSKRHHDGEECFGGGWFIVMANLPTGQISNHYELKDWDLFQIPEKEIADEWDGHTPQEAAERLHKYLLERQGEQPADKIESKFKDGDWVVKQDGENFWNGDYAAQITNTTNRDEHWLNIGCWVEARDIRLWSINDAKDGDLIYVSTELKGIQAIFHKFENGIIYFHCNLCSDFMQGGYEPSGDVKSVHPLSKTQHQKFFQKMKQAGYEWRQEEKKLIKINEPKFKEGDCIVPYDTTSLKIWKVINIDEDGYYKIQSAIDPEDDEIYCVPGFFLERDYRLWTNKI